MSQHSVIQPPATLLSLPFELNLMILEQVDSPRDLLSLASSCSAMRAVYMSNPRRYLLAAVRNGCPAELWDEFCAVQCATRLFRPLRSHDDVVADGPLLVNFVNAYFANAVGNDINPHDTADVRAAVIRHDRIEWLMADFVRNVSLDAKSWISTDIVPEPASPPDPAITVPSPPGSPSSSSSSNGGRLYRAYQPPQLTETGHFTGEDARITAAFDLSPTERCCLYRGFLRFELYCRLFRPPQSPGEVTGYTMEDYSYLFLGRFREWELEEISCVHQFLKTISQSAGDDLDRDFTQYVQRLDHVRRRASPPVPGVKLSNLAGTRLHLFSDAYRHDMGVLSEGTIVARGLGYMRRFARANSAHKCALLRSQALGCDILGHGLLFTTLRHSEGDLRHMPVPSHEPIHWPSGSYFQFFRESFSDCDNHALFLSRRALGYVFWDEHRYELDCDVGVALNMLDSIAVFLPLAWDNGRYTRAQTQAPESALQGLEVPFDSISDLLSRYGMHLSPVV